MLPRRIVLKDLGVLVREVRGVAPAVHCDGLISLGLARIGLILFRHSVETGGVPVRRGERLSVELCVSSERKDCENNHEK